MQEETMVVDLCCGRTFRERFPQMEEQTLQLFLEQWSEGAFLSLKTDGQTQVSVSAEGGGRIVEWRTLDARYFGVAQRRRRVFALLDTGAWYSRPPILFEQECVFGNFTQSQSEWERTTRGACQSPSHDNQMERGTDLKAYDVRLTHDGTNEASKRANVYETDIVRTVDRDGNQPHHQQGGVLVFSRPRGGVSMNVNDNIAGTLLAKAHPQIVAEPQPVIYENHPQDSRVKESKGVCQALTSRMGTGGGNVPLTTTRWETMVCSEIRLKTGYANPLCARDYKDPTITNALYGEDYIVRRITPEEAERLQGFPDGWTDIPYKGKEHSPDSPRYMALGNSMAVPVMKWIAQRIDWALAHPITENTAKPVDWQPSLFF